MRKIIEKYHHTDLMLVLMYTYTYTYIRTYIHMYITYYFCLHTPLGNMFLLISFNVYKMKLYNNTTQQQQHNNNIIYGRKHAGC